MSAGVSASSQSYRPKRTQDGRVGSPPGAPPQLVKRETALKEPSFKGSRRGGGGTQGGTEAPRRQQRSRSSSSWSVPRSGWGSLPSGSADTYSLAGGGTRGIGNLSREQGGWDRQRPGEAGREGGRWGRPWFSLLGRAAFLVLGRRPAGGAAVWVRSGSQREAWDRACFQSWPPPQRCFRILPGKPAAGGSG